MKKKVIITGPIGDFGGREIEVNIIAKSLENDFKVEIVSTGYLTGNSFALKSLKRTKWFCVSKTLASNNILLLLLSYLSKILNIGKKEFYAYLNNSLAKRIFDLDVLYLEEIYKKIEKANLVLLCVQLSSKYLPEIVLFCEQKKIPCLVRTTGTIREVSELDFLFLKKVNLFIHHSETNADNLNKKINLPYTIIDQCALNEDQLLALEIKTKKDLRFGYIGRLSEEKGILPIADFFSKTNLPFIVAGEGNQKDQLLEIIKDKSSCSYLGIIANESLDFFFDKIDVLIIPSYEESGPLVGLEAMAAGKIIISTKVGAMEERLDGLNSFWFQIEKLSTLQLTITQVLLLNEYEKFRISSSLRKRYVDNHSLKVISEKYLLIIEQYI